MKEKRGGGSLMIKCSLNGLKWGRWQRGLYISVAKYTISVNFWSLYYLICLIALRTTAALIKVTK